MSVKIRLRRTGARNQPSYRIMVVDSRKKRDGKFIEKLGYYDPKPDSFIYKVDKERALYWLNKGAIPSSTVRSLLKKDGIFQIIHEKKFGHSTSKTKKVENSKEVENEQNENAQSNAGGAK